MPGKELSRWTMAWFAAALGFLVAALGLAVLGTGGPGGWAEGGALAMVHLFTLGWLGLAMQGALIQFVPVLVARPPALPGLALPALVLGVLGVLALAGGMWSLTGWATGVWLLQVAPVVLGMGFALVLILLGRTLISGPGLRACAPRAVAAALGGMVLVWLSGLGMALALTGLADTAALVAGGLGLHIIAGVAGWLGLAAFGVSYRLFAMFLLAPEGDSRLRRAGFGLSVLALAAVLAGLAALLAGWDGDGSLAGALAAAGAAALIYLADIRRLWRQRRRPQPEVNMQMTRAALAFLAATVLLMPPAFSLGGAWAEAAVFAALAGWLSTLTLAQMIKIVSFLTWIEVFSPRIGRGPVPQVQDLTDARRVRRALWLWVAGAGCGTLSLLAESAAGFRLAALLMTVAAACLAAELLAMRRLSHLPVALRPLPRPPIFVPSKDRSQKDDSPSPLRA